MDCLLTVPHPSPAGSMPAHSGRALPSAALPPESRSPTAYHAWGWSFLDSQQPGRGAQGPALHVTPTPPPAQRGLGVTETVPKTPGRRARPMGLKHTAGKRSENMVTVVLP